MTPPELAAISEQHRNISLFQNHEIPSGRSSFFDVCPLLAREGSLNPSPSPLSPLLARDLIILKQRESFHAAVSFGGGDAQKDTFARSPWMPDSQRYPDVVPLKPNFDHANTSEHQPRKDARVHHDSPPQVIRRYRRRHHHS